MSPFSEQAYRDMVRLLSKDPEAIVKHLTVNPLQAHLWHMATGVSGEAGELLDAIKKHVVYGKEPDIENIIEELGDLEFYMEGIRQHFQITREETLKANMDKLHTGKAARYKNGYSDKAAQQRADKQDTTTDQISKRQLNVYWGLKQGAFLTYSINMGDSDYALYWNPRRKVWCESASITNKMLHERATPLLPASIDSNGEPYV